VPLLAICFALHSSLQHELLHGNPCRRQWMNDVLAFPAVGLFVPYLRFKATHLAHHQDERLTDPHDDPESNYLHPQQWDACPAWLRSLYRFNNTLLGRMLVGPVIGMSVFYWNDAKAILRGNIDIIKAYVLHGLGIALFAVWILGYRRPSHRHCERQRPTSLGVFK